jgi:CRP-like cAMP-binding protein
VRGVFTNSTQTVSLAAGEVLFTAGDQGHQMFGVISGQIDLKRNGETVYTVDTGGTFGELAIIDARPRSLTAVATQPSELAVIDQRHFLFLVTETPTFALDVMRGLAQRIHELAGEL